MQIGPRFLTSFRRRKQVVFSAVMSLLFLLLLFLLRLLSGSLDTRFYNLLVRADIRLVFAAVALTTFILDRR